MSLLDNIRAGVKKGVLQHRFDVNLSGKLSPTDFSLNDIEYLGLPGTIGAVAYDPVQGLLAVGTSSGSIHIYGDEGVSQVMALSKPNPVRYMKFRSGFPTLIVIDSTNILQTFNLHDFEKDIMFILRANVTCWELVPSMDWLFLGMGDGCVDVFDLDSGVPASDYRIRSLWHARQQKQKSRTMVAKGKPSIVIDMQIHPRQLDQILIAYPEGIVLYDLKQRQEIRWFELILPAYAPGGGNRNLISAQSEQRCFVTTIFWRSNGLGFVAGYDDGCIAMWDGNNSENPLFVRTEMDEDVHLPISESSFSEDIDEMNLRDPIFRLAWCTYEKEDVLVVAGGQKKSDVQGLQIYHFRKENQLNNFQRQKFLPVMVEIADFVLLPNLSPWLGMAHNPFAIIVITGMGSLIAYNFPKGDPRLFLPPSLEMLQSPIKVCKYFVLSQDAFIRLTLGINQVQDVSLKLTGGKPTKVGINVQRYSIVVTAHEDGYIRFWDLAGKCKLLHHLTLDISKYVTLSESDLSSFTPPKIDNFDLSGKSLEMAVAIANGEVIIFRFGEKRERTKEEEAIINERVEKELKLVHQRRVSAVSIKSGIESLLFDAIKSKSEMTNVGSSVTLQNLGETQMSSEKQLPTVPLEEEQSSKTKSVDEEVTQVEENASNIDDVGETERPVRESSANNIMQENSGFIDLSNKASWTTDGFKPVGLVKIFRGDVTCLRVSDIGFIGIGFEYKNLTILDLRGPSLILSEDFTNPIKPVKEVLELIETECVPRSLEFYISYMDDEEMSPEICFIAGHTNGVVGVYNLLKVNGVYEVVKEKVFQDSKLNSDPIIASFVIEPSHGIDQPASPENLASLLEMQMKPIPESRDPHLLVLVTSDTVSVHYDLSSQRIFHGEIGNYGKGIVAQLIRNSNGMAIVILTERGELIMMSLPKCEVITRCKIPYFLEGRLLQTTISKRGHIFSWTSANEMALWTLFPVEPLKGEEESNVEIYDVNMILPDRPLMSTWTSWLGGGQSTSVEEMDEIIGGSKRPPPRRPRLITKNSTNNVTGVGSSGGSNSGIFAQMGQIMNERAQRLGEITTKFDALESATSEWARNAKLLAEREAAKKWYQL